MRAGHKSTIRMTTVATPAEGVSLDQLVEILKFRGIDVLQIDRDNNRVVVAQEERTLKWQD